jgi:hypothetical protein
MSEKNRFGIVLCFAAVLLLIIFTMRNDLAVLTLAVTCYVLGSYFIQSDD